MVCMKVVSTPVKANLNSQYISSQQIFEFKCQEVKLLHKLHMLNMLYHQLFIISSV